MDGRNCNEVSRVEDTNSRVDTRYTNGGPACMEPHKILPMVPSDIDVLVIRGDEGSHEETSERISTVPG